MFRIVILLAAIGVAGLVGVGLLRLVLRHLYVVPTGEFHVVRLLGARTVVRRPGLHLHLGRFEDRRAVDAQPFIVHSPLTTTSHDGTPLRVTAQFELVVVDPVRYERAESSFKIRGRAAGDVVLAAEIGRRTLGELHGAIDALEAAVRLRLTGALREFGVHVRDTRILVAEATLGRLTG